MDEQKLALRSRIEAEAGNSRANGDCAGLRAAENRLKLFRAQTVPTSSSSHASSAIKSFSTQGVAAVQVARYWAEVIEQTYFNLQLSFPDQSGFTGRLDKWDLGILELSRLESRRLVYRRLRPHCQAREPQILITVPFETAVAFTQFDRTTRCAPGQYLLQLSEEPYQFGYGQDNLLWVMKVPVAALQARIGEPSRFCARPFDSQQGTGRLFVDYLRLLVQHSTIPHQDAARVLMGRQVIDLLALSLEQHPDALQSSMSAVRDAHLARIEAYVRRQLGDPQLTPERIAAASGISLRYLHALFKETGQSVSQWIRAQRLQSAHEALQCGDPQATVSQVAYAAGFNDHAHFTHAYRRQFGCTPSDVLRASRRERDGL
jgi:AraC-like DNA-binding protein